MLSFVLGFATGIITFLFCISLVSVIPDEEDFYDIEDYLEDEKDENA